jgi:uncharacterized protein YkwD
MKNRHLKVASAILIIATMSFLSGCETEPDVDINKFALTAAEMELYNLIMDYRDELSLPQIPLSSSLSYVARQHVADLQENNPVTSICNLHSWSDNGNWTACCYTSDHAQAACMWNKPRELTDYSGNGYEIAYYSSGSATPAGALNGWKSSSGHNNVIINAGSWSMQWNAIGVGIKGGYAVVWFGHEEDPAGPPG